MGYREAHVLVVKEPVRSWKKRNGEHQYWTFVVAKYICQCRCKKCKGDKVVKEKTRQEIFIEKGMVDNQRIVLAGAGDQEVVSFHHLSHIVERDACSPVCLPVMSSFFWKLFHMNPLNGQGMIFWLTSLSHCLKLYWAFHVWSSRI